MKLKLKLTLVAVLPASLLTALPAGAHHSSAMFDSDQELRLEGVVTRWDYLNPHSWLYVNVENEDGSVTEWGFESDSPPLLRRIGVSPNFWKPGDRVIIKTHPLRDGRPAGALAGAITEGGKPYGDTEGLE